MSWQVDWDQDGYDVWRSDSPVAMNVVLEHQKNGNAIVLSLNLFQKNVAGQKTAEQKESVHWEEGVRNDQKWEPFHERNDHKWVVRKADHNDVAVTQDDPGFKKIK